MGTFAPVTDENMQSKKLHEEYFEIPHNSDQLINRSDRKREIVAVGTTVARTLESVKKRIDSRFRGNDKKVAGKNQVIGQTSLFIYPPYQFKTVDHLITNFHLPGSSLMMLVEAFLQHKKAKRRLINLYQIAIEHNFRFYSFGDAMIIL